MLFIKERFKKLFLNLYSGKSDKFIKKILKFTKQLKRVGLGNLSFNWQSLVYILS